MLGCLTAIAIIIIIALIFNFPASAFGLVIGLGITVWGFHERNINKKHESKSKKPILIAIFGILIVFSFLIAGSINSNPESNKEPYPDQQQPGTPPSEPENKEKLDRDTISEDWDNSLGSDDSNEINNLTEPDLEEKQESVNKLNLESATVTRIVDGDTIEIKLNGQIESVRLLLVDTPETVHPSEPVQKYGPEASTFAKKTLTGKQVHVEYDGPKRDRYDRLLAYLWIGDRMFNEMLLEGGYARLAYVYDPPYTHYQRYMRAQNRAKDKELRIWSIDNYIHEDGFYHQNKANSINQGDDTYRNCDAVRDAGAAPIHKGDPGYGSHLDGDGDGIACE